jgi:hypothetical protein
MFWRIGWPARYGLKDSRGRRVGEGEDFGGGVGFLEGTGAEALGVLLGARRKASNSSSIWAIPFS